MWYIVLGFKSWYRKIDRNRYGTVHPHEDQIGGKMLENINFRLKKLVFTFLD